MNKDNEDMSEEDILKASEAYLIFVQRFGEYVKEMNPELWHRAREYAADFTKVTGVTIELVCNPLYVSFNIIIIHVSYKHFEYPSFRCSRCTIDQHGVFG